MAVKRTYKLNLKNYGNLPAIMLSQYDEGYALEFEIRDGMSAASDLSSYTVTLKGTRYDTLSYSFTGTISTNVLTFIIDTTMTACAGKGTAEIVIAGSNDVAFATFNMPVFVEKAAVPDDAVDADVERAQEIADQIQEIVDTAAEETTAEARQIVADLEEDVADVKEDLNAVFVTDSASGSVGHFVDGADNVPMKSLKVNIEPAQSGSGDPSPSNVRPISGWDSVKVTRAGENLCKLVDSTGTYSGVAFTVADGVITVDGTATANVYRGTINISLKAGTYTVTNIENSDTADAYVLVSDTSTNPSSWSTLANLSNGSPVTFTLDHDIVVAVRVAVRNGTTVSNKVFKPMLVYGSDAPTEYEPYNGNTYTISLSSAGTVYGGTLDVVSGELAVDKAIVDLGTLTWTYDSATPRFYTNGLQSVISQVNNSEVIDGLSTMYKVVSFYDLYTQFKENGSIAVSNGKAVSVINTDYTDATSFKTAMSGQMLVYPLANPQTYQLTPQQVTSLLGINNVWSDVGDVEVEYRADTKLYIDKKLGV